MPTLVLELLKYAFLVVLYIFMARAIRAVYLELRPAGAAPRRSRSAPAPVPSRPPSRKTRKTARKVAVVEGEQHKGKTFEIGDEITIGRADKCTIRVDDPYVSQVHARIFARDSGHAVEDMGSTNGTYVNRRRITAPAEVSRGDRVKIGRTVLELRK